MRKLILTLFAVAASSGIGTFPAGAVGNRYPFCIQGPDQPGLSNCTFVSYEQCQASASGRLLNCVANPFYVGDRDEPADDSDRGVPPPPPPRPSRY